jgi:putative tricarboxylic transport membrane protein
MNSINQVSSINAKYTNVRLRDMRPAKDDVKQAIAPMFRGTLVGSLCALIPGTGPTIASFVARRKPRPTRRCRETSFPR